MHGRSGWGYLRVRYPAGRQAAKMLEDWGRRARENARYFIATGQESWTDEELFASGERARTIGAG